jgi:MEDS: MEthanogen/methylotroph, DcmR Sensory domain
VTWIDAEEAYGPGFEPEAAAARVRGMAEASPRRLRLVGSLRDDMSADTLRRYERLAQDVAIEHEITGLCLYDAEVLDEEYLVVCRDTHPLVARDEGLRRNPAFAWSPSC